MYNPVWYKQMLKTILRIQTRPRSDLDQNPGGSWPEIDQIRARIRADPDQTPVRSGPESGRILTRNRSDSGQNPGGSRPDSGQIWTRIRADPNQTPVRSGPESGRILTRPRSDPGQNPVRSGPFLPDHTHTLTNLNEWRESCYLTYKKYKTLTVSCYQYFCPNKSVSIF